MSQQVALKDVEPPRKSWWQRFKESWQAPRCPFCGQPEWRCLNQSALCFGSGS